MFFTKKTEKRIAKATLALYALSTIGVFGLGGATASAAEAPVCTTIDLGSSIATKSAGYTETNPSASPLSAALYAHPFAASFVTASTVPPWVNPATDANFVGSAAQWISTDASWPGGIGNTEGSSTLNQWRLYQDEFTVPANATGTTLNVWYTGDDATALYHNGTFADMTGVDDDVFGTVPTTTPGHFTSVFHKVLTPGVGTNTVSFVVRNWGTDGTSNPTGLLYRAVVQYCVPAPVTDVTVLIAKYVNGVLATATSTNGAAFPMTATWNATNIGTGTGQFMLESSTSSTPYQAISPPMTMGANFATNEILGGGVVAANCATGTPFALTGYTVGESESAAALATPTTTPPNLQNITSNKFVIVWNSTCALATTTPVTTGSLVVSKKVVGGTATSSDFMIHVMHDGMEIVGSPATATLSGKTYAGLASSTYAVSESGPTANYVSVFSGDCNAVGVVMVTGSTTKNCMITNTFVPTTTPTTLKVHILKYLNGSVASASTSAGYLFPMSATWKSANLSGGATSTGTYVLGTSIGGAVNMYGADTAAMQSPAYYTTSEVTGAGSGVVLPVGAVCATTSYRLVGYRSSDISFADAATQSMSTSAPIFANLTADKYLIVMNETCTPGVVPPVTISPKAEKEKILAELVALKASLVNVNAKNARERGENEKKNNDKKILTRVIADLRTSLRANLWVTDTRLNDRKGDKVFDAEQEAVIDLKVLYNSKRSAVSQTVVLDLITRLAADDRAIAVAAIADAVAAGGVAANIANANVALASGDAATALGHYVTAIGYYQDAWGFAVTSF
jgi:hypothetical protein